MVQRRDDLPAVALMQPTELREIIASLELSQARFAELLGQSPRTGQYWATQSVPNPVACVALLLNDDHELVPRLKRVVEKRIAAAVKKGGKA